MRKILITGKPHSGKSTLLQTVVARYENKQGFITREITDNGVRSGFGIVTASGKEQLLASVHSDSTARVSRYGVDVTGFEKLLPELFIFSHDQLLYIDEIGQMEFLAPSFTKLVQLYVEAPNLFIGTISKVYTDNIVQALREDKKILLIDIDELGRDGAMMRVRQEMENP